MNIIILTVLTLSVTLSQAYDCVCPTEGLLHVYTLDYSKDETQIVTASKGCFRIIASYTGGYGVVMKGEIGFVNRVDVRIQENCTAETMKGHNSISKRFLFASMMKGMMEGMKSTMGGMMTGAEKMACYSTCGVCDCDDACFNRQPCKLCKDFICSKNQAHFQHQSQTTLSTAIIQSTNKQTTHSLKHTPGYQTTDKITTKITVSPTSIPADTSTTANQSPINVTLKGTNNSPCQSSPCLNGGFCVDKGQTYLCYCQSSPLGSIINTGKRCEFHIDLSKTLTTTEAPWFVIPGK